MSSRRKNTKPKANNNSAAALQKSLSVVSDLNKEMALNMQRLKEDLSNTMAQNLSLKGELYETLADRNCLWETNMRLIELLRTLQAECLSFGRRIDELLYLRECSTGILNVGTPNDYLPCMQYPETPREWSNDMQNAENYAAPNDHIIRTNNFEPGILYSRRSPGAVYIHAQETNNLSPIAEEQCDDVVTSRLGRRSRLTQNNAPSRNSGCGETFCSGKASLERKLSGCVMFRNRDEVNVSPTLEQPPCYEEARDLIAEDMKSVEEGKSMKHRASLAGKRNSSGGRRKSSLLTINIMQAQSDPQASSPVLVNVLPRKRRYASKLSLNEGFLDIGFSEVTNKNEDTKGSAIIDSKIPAVVLERLPVLENMFSPTFNEEGSSEVFKVSPVAKLEKRKSTKKSWRPSITKHKNCSDKRRSVRNQETISYKK